MPVRAVRGAVQVDADEPAQIVDAAGEVVTELLTRNQLEPDDLISMILTATPDLTAAFPAYGVRVFGIDDVPLLCATEIAVPDAMPRVIRVLAHVNTSLSKAELRHVYLRGATALRTDLDS